MSQIRITDGITIIDIDQDATASLTQSYESAGGSVVHRTLDGTAVKQTHWSGAKRRITVSGGGWMPPILQTIDYTLPLTITLRNPEDTAPDGPGVAYSVFADPPREQWVINDGSATWTLVGEEI